jgi:hypothetical protein
MKMILGSLAALSFAAPALAQEWPKQDWYVLTVPLLSQQAPASTMRDGGASPPYETIAGPAVRPDSRPARRQTVALNINSLSRIGAKVEVSYFVWSDEKSDYTEITSRIDCSRTGEQIVLWRSYDRDLAHVGTSDQGFRRIDATSRAVANYACRLPRDHRVSSKSLPEIVEGRS